MSSKDNFWIPYADLMTVLMVIFLFISLAYMGIVQLQKQRQDAIFEEYKQAKESLYQDLHSTFKGDFERWNIALDRDLSIKFTNPEVLFPSGESQLTPKFKAILADFLPKYLGVVLDPRFRNKIAEIRIEGHTDDVPLDRSSPDPYLENVQLSQDRSRNVLAFLRSLPEYKRLPASQEALLRFWLTANGLSFGRTLDKDRHFTILSHQPIDREVSRRVEFRIVTTSEQLVEKVIQGLDR